MNLAEVETTVLTRTTALKGVVGSTAYGLNRAGSDIDYLAVHVDPTETLVNLYPNTKFSIQQHDPDLTTHEIGRACQLIFNGNPTLNEVLWLPEYMEMNWIGAQLVEYRMDFLSRSRVRDSYLGYAGRQYGRFIDRGRFAGSLETRRRKHALHVARLVHQGVELYRTGNLELRVQNPDWYHMVADLIANKGTPGIEIAEAILRDGEEQFDSINSPLPESPRTDRIDRLILDARHENWSWT